MFWSILAPLLTLLVMKFVFGHYFGRRINHYTIYLFCGNIIYSYFRESINAWMMSLMSNAGIFTKVNVPKFLFLFSKNVSILINFRLTLILLLIFILAYEEFLHSKILSKNRDEIELVAKKLQERKKEKIAAQNMDAVKKTETMLYKENTESAVKAAALFLQKKKTELLK